MTIAQRLFAKQPSVISLSSLLCLLFMVAACQPMAAPAHHATIMAAAEGAASGQESHQAVTAGNEARPELAERGPIELNPAQGQEIGAMYEAFLSPHQEGGEEADTPAAIPAQFRSTAPSVDRNDRPSRGHGVLTFTKDLSKAYVYVAVEGVELEEIVMFHIHCGRPGQLGPILVDFGLAGDLKEFMADGFLALEITNEDIVAVTDHSQGLIGAFTSGCPIVPAIPMDKVKTIAGMELIARQGELYFNLHTAGQTFFGDIRGQLYLVER